MRFRQHLPTEMAHYACDCWDMEIETSYGWIEVAGHADRSAFDLTKHSEKTKIDLYASRPVKPHRIETVALIMPNKKVIGAALKRESKALIDHLEAMNAEQKMKMAEEFKATGKVEVHFRE